MVVDVAGVVGAIASVVGATADVDEEVIGADQICASSMVVVVKLMKPVVQVIWSMMNVMLPATAAELGMMAIWFTWEAIRTPSTWRATVDES